MISLECNAVIAKLEVLSQPFFAESWDNVGLLAGRRNKEVNSVYIALDATDEVICDAIEKKADMLITHHPLIFSPLKKINTDDFIGRRLIAMLQRDISYYAMHTNFDITHMADLASDYLNLTMRSVLEVTYEGEGSKKGIGKIGFLPREMTLKECCDFVKERFGLYHVKAIGNFSRKIETVAIAPGSGKSVIKAALKAGVEVLITGDIDHHEGLDATAQGLEIIDAGHYGLEHIFVPFMVDYIKKECEELTIYAAKDKNPFQIV